MDEARVAGKSVKTSCGAGVEHGDRAFFSSRWKKTHTRNESENADSDTHITPSPRYRCEYLQLYLGKHDRN